MMLNVAEGAHLLQKKKTVKKNVWTDLGLEEVRLEELWRLKILMNFLFFYEINDRFRLILQLGTDPYSCKPNE